MCSENRVEEGRYDKTHMVLADGDYALACSEGSFGGVPTTYYDLFRVENGFIAEHWDVMETLAAKETWYDAENAAAIVGHADPLTLDTETGNFVTAEGTAVASPIQ